MTPARTQSYFSRAYGIEATSNSTVTADSPLVGMAWATPKPCMARPAAGAAHRRIAAVAAGRHAHLGRKRARHDRPREQSRTSRRTSSCACRRLRQFADLFSPSRASISEAVIPPTSRFIGKTSAQLRFCANRTGSACWRSTATSRCCATTSRQHPIRAGDMLVLHSIWTDLAQAIQGKDFVVVTDYPKDEQRPHKVQDRDGDLRRSSMLLA